MIPSDALVGRCIMQTENLHELAFYEQGKQFIVGIDEAGRGPIAGPLVVAAVQFEKGYTHPSIYDSKKLSEKKRNELFHVIINDAKEYHILIIEPKVIDELNIYRATQKAMEDLVKMFQKVDGVLTDAMPLRNCPCDFEAIVKGDQKSVSIAAASILAKVTRDHIMAGYDLLYPAYGFKKHKGYPTKAHLEALEKEGVLPIHRFSYGPVAKQNQCKLQFDE